jgi:hypothetical protein
MLRSLQIQKVVPSQPSRQPQSSRPMTGSSPPPISATTIFKRG